MAMQMTHIRFAAEILERSAVNDRNSFFLGAVYPDSRYLTKVKRSVTHGEGAPKDPFDKSNSDFKKGWASHLMYDQLSSEILWPLLGLSRVDMVGDDAWLRLSAAKMVEESHSVDVSSSLRPVFKKLNFSLSPNGESIQELNEWLSIQEEIYGDASSEVLRPEPLKKILPDKVYLDLQRVYSEMKEDTVLVQKIKRIFDQVMRQL